MIETRNPWLLFGLDLRMLGTLWRQGWREALRTAPLRHLAPQLPVRVIGADASLQCWQGDHCLPRALATPFAAIALPDDLVLLRTLQLPLLADAELAQAVALDVSSVAPFPADQVVYGFRSRGVGPGRVAVDVAIASCGAVEGWIEQRLQGAADPAGVEVWAHSPAGVIVLNGFAEPSRARAQRRVMRRNLALAAMLLLLLLSLLLSPFLQARAQVFDAQSRFAQLRAETAAAVDARDRLALVAERSAALQAWRAETPALMPLLERLTELLPDDAFLNSFELRGDTVTISGMSRNAASLMDAFSAQTDFAEIRPSGIARDGRTGLETFTIEFKPRAAAGEGV